MYLSYNSIYPNCNESSNIITDLFVEVWLTGVGHRRQAWGFEVLVVVIVIVLAIAVIVKVIVVIIIIIIVIMIIMIIIIAHF